MHYLLLVTLTMSPSATSAEVRQEVFNRLVNDTTFCGEGGRFGTPLCDWFVIGGRWSGHISEVLIGNSYQQAVQLECPEAAAGYLQPDTAQSHRETLNRLWSRLGGKDESPRYRDPYDNFGYEDDAVLVQQEVFDALLREHLSVAWDGQSFVDLEDEPVDESFIGRKWLVVVDYHN